MATISDFPPMNWSQFISIPNGTRVVNYGYDQCVAVANLYHVSVYGKPLPTGLGAAYQWWTTYASQPNTYNNYTQSQNPVTGALVVWNTTWGGGYGHIGVVTGVNANGTFNTIEQNAETWRYLGRYTRGRSAVLGFLVPRNNPASSGTLAGNERRVNVEELLRRAEPNTSSAVLPNPLKNGDVGTFNGWIRGENVRGNNVWFRGALSGNWFWSGGFEDKGTHDLQDLNPVAPPAPASNQRVVGSQGANVRKEPKASGGLIRSMSSGTVVTPEGWVRGESITSGGVTSNIWYKLSDGYAWAEGFTVSNTDGLKDLNYLATPTPEPPKPAPVPGSHTPDLKTPQASDFPSWIKFDVKIDPELTPTHNAELFEYYGVEYQPIESHIHWWGDPASGFTHDGVVNGFLGKENHSVNFVVSDNRITLMVPMNQNAITTGRRNPYAWKTENDPNLSEQGYKTLGFLHYLVEKMNPSLQDTPIRLHKEFMATACSNLDPAKVREYANKFKNGILDVATGEPVIKPEPPKPEPTPSQDFKELVDAINKLTVIVEKQNELLIQIYRID